jgi:CBS domain-containing membrane protein
MPETSTLKRFQDLLDRIAPELPGATLRGQGAAVFGAAVAVLLAALTGAWVHGYGESMPWLAPPMAASALLVFALPSSPLAQPWPVLGGNCLSALIGVGLGRALGHGAFVYALAVALAITAMSSTRSLHPPGVASAVLGVAGGTAGWLFPFAPLGLNLVVLLLAGWAFHRFSAHTYPHRPARPMTLAPGSALSAVSEEDIDAVLAEAGEAFDIEREDLRMLLSRLEVRLAQRR